MRLGIIIPFFQRRQGLLQAAINSIICQTVVNCDIRIIIVDDESPIDPATELSLIEIPPHIKVDVIRRGNGGPGPARNTGLDSLHNEDVIAFLDSDDIWDSGHLSRAFEAFEKGECEFYFCDSQIESDLTNFGQAQFPFFDSEFQKISGNFDDIYLITRENAVQDLARDYISHTSTILFKNVDGLSRHRFDEQLRLAGEDHLMWATLANDAKRTCFSTHVGSTRGHGVDLFRSINYRDRARWLERNCAAVLKYCQFRNTFQLNGTTSKTVDESIYKYSVEILRVIIRPAGAMSLFRINNLKIFFQIFPYPWIYIFHMFLGKSK